MSEQKKFECEFCNTKYKTKFILKTHINTNKKCLSSRGLSLQTNFICEGCNSMFITTNHLTNHQESCKDYIILINDKKYKEDFDKQEIIYVQKLKEQEIYFTDKINQYKNLYENLEKKYKLRISNLEEKYKETKEENKLRISNLESIIERLASEAMNKTTTINNNMVREHLSTQYTIDSITDRQLEERIRSCMTEKIFWEGQRGLAKMCVESIIKTPDNKMMICCTDTSRCKFKLFDVKGNLKEDIDARLFTDRVSKFIKIVCNEIREAIQESTMLEEKDGPEKNQLFKKMEQLGYSLYDVLIFNEIKFLEVN